MRAGSGSDGLLARGTDRGAVEPVAALVALLAVGAGLGLYTVAIDDATPSQDRDVADTILDRVERESAVGGVIDPNGLVTPRPGPYAGATVELRTRSSVWHRSTGEHAPTATETSRIGSADADESMTSIDVAETTVTVRVAPGRNVRGTIRVVVRR